MSDPVTGNGTVDVDAVKERCARGHANYGAARQDIDDLLIEVERLRAQRQAVLDLIVERKVLDNHSGSRRWFIRVDDVQEALGVSGV